jgi:hypothetical protein
VDSSECVKCSRRIDSVRASGRRRSTEHSYCRAFGSPHVLQIETSKHPVFPKVKCGSDVCIQVDVASFGIIHAPVHHPSFTGHGTPNQRNSSMREFFRGWRRKVGCVTLLLACMFTTCWVRSLTKWDEVNLDRGLGHIDAVESHAGEIRCLRWHGWVSRRKWTWQTTPHNQGGEYSFNGIHRCPGERNFGPDLSNVEETGIYPPDRRAYGAGFRISYVCIVGPLILITAILLLYPASSRKRTRPMPGLVGQDEIVHKPIA